MDLSGRVPVHLLPEPLLFWGTELDRKDDLVLGLVFFFPKDPTELGLDLLHWSSKTTDAKALDPPSTLMLQPAFGIYFPKY